jgi:hypothetical protein
LAGFSVQLNEISADEFPKIGAFISAALNDSYPSCSANLLTTAKEAETWIASALFLAWDRLILDKGSQTKLDLLNYVADNELHKLLGISELDTRSQADPLAALYQDIGAVERFASPTPPTVAAELSKKANSEWIEIKKRQIRQ